MNQPQRGGLKRGDKKKDYFFSIKQLVCSVIFFLKAFTAIYDS